MSITLFAYAPQEEPVGKSELERRLRSLGWDALWLEDWHQVTLADGEALQGGLVACGWKADSALSNEVRDATARRDRAALEQLYDVSSLATCQMYSSARDLSDAALEEDFAEKVEGIAASAGRPDQVEALRDHKRMYTFETSAGRSPLSTEFQEVLCWAVADITGAVMENIHEKLSFTRENPQPPHRDRASGKREGTVPGVARSKHGGAAPWWVIGWYSGFAALGIVLIALGKSSDWYTWVALLHGPVAYGLYRANRAAWYLSIVLTAAGLVLIPVFLLLQGGGARIVLPTLFYGYTLARLLAAETRDTSVLSERVECNNGGMPPFGATPWGQASIPHDDGLRHNVPSNCTLSLMGTVPPPVSLE